MFNEFTKSKLKLTFWYTLVILFISGSLSSLLYIRTVGVLRHQYQQIEWRMQKNESPRHLQPLNPNLMVLQDEFTFARNQILKQLLLINVMIMGFGAGASYFLAGKTLKPIQISMQKQKRFIADAAHELRTPITALKTSLEVNLMDKKISKKSRQILEDNLQDVTSLQSLTDNLLRLARLDDRSAKYHQTISIRKVITRALRHVKPLAKQKNISIKTKLTKNKLWVAGNEDELVEVVMILLDNAVKYSPEKSCIKLQLSAKRKHVQLAVIDHGPGIAPENHDHVFERFFQTDTARSKSQSGFGLGLAVAEQIIKQHHGKIELTSSPNQGSTFTIELPRA